MLVARTMAQVPVDMMMVNVIARMLACSGCSADGLVAGASSSKAATTVVLPVDL